MYIGGHTMQRIGAFLLLFTLLALGIGCASQTSVQQLEEDLAQSETEIQDLRLELDSLKSQLSSYVDAIRAEAGNLAARQILGDWSRSTPQSIRTQNNYRVLRDSVRDPEGGAASQLNRALVRTANASALIYIFEQMDGQLPTRQLEVLNQCLEYILGVTSSTRSCNLEPIAP